MRTLLATAVLALAAPAAAGGCFYSDPINERPSADIERQPDNPVRGGRVQVAAQVIDPDGDPTVRQWRAFACGGGACEVAPFDEGTEIVFEVDVPTHVSPGGPPVERVRIELDVTDDLGAIAVPRQTLDIDIGNAGPTLEPQRQGHTYRGQFPVVMPMRIVAVKDDPDDGAAGVTVVDPPTVFPAPGTTLEGSSITLVDETAEEVTWELTVDEPGQWEVELTGVDPLGAAFTAMIAVPFALDQWPCLASAEPAFPPDGARVVLDQRRRFAVLTVEDDLDVWPPPPPDPYFDAASFRWWLASPASGGALLPLDGVDGGEVWLDPAHFQPGDRLELRVEVADREDRALCDAGLASCEALVGCAQRRTWAVEVR